MMRRLAIPVLLVLATPACGGKVVVDGDPGATTSTSVGGSGGNGGNGGSGGNGGIGGNGGTGGTGGAPACKETHDALSVTLNTWDGKTYDCALGPSDYEFSARVELQDGKGFFGLDSCSPAADCTTLSSKLGISAPGLATDVPEGTYVRVHIAIDLFKGGCAQRIQIKNLPAWDGVPNPIMPGEHLWFLGVEGGVGAFADTPFMATPEPLGCFPDDSPSCGGHDDFLLHFQVANNPSDPGAAVMMGGMAYLGANLPGGSQYVSAHNLRSFSSGLCDGPVNLAYWMKHEYPLD